jgi:hypothetical protein
MLSAPGSDEEEIHCTCHDLWIRSNVDEEDSVRLAITSVEVEGNRQHGLPYTSVACVKHATGLAFRADGVPNLVYISFHRLHGLRSYQRRQISFH